MDCAKMSDAASDEQCTVKKKEENFNYIQN